MVGIDINTILPQYSGTEIGRGCGSCGSGEGGAKCGNGLEKVYPTTAVRFGYMKHIGEFTHQPNLKFTCGAKVVLQTKRGLEIGEQVSLTCSGCDKAVTREQMQAYAKASGGDALIFGAGKIIREATMADLSEYARIQEAVAGRRNLCQALARQYKLPLKVVECEIIFGGERIIFYFKAEERVDFRELVKDLSGELQTRIEMRQIGARDEARLLADYETCGREVCCKVFLKTLKPISMKMAKLQKSTIDPTKVSGRCGRLKCCLRYEHTAYEELDRRLPRVGVRVRTSDEGDGVVINRQILTQLLHIRKEDDTLATIAVESVIKVLLAGEPAQPSKAAAEAKTPQESPGRSTKDAGPEARPVGREERDSAKRRRKPRRASGRKRVAGGTEDAKPSGGDVGANVPVEAAPSEKKKDDPSAGAQQGGKRKGGRPRNRRRWRRRTGQSGGSSDQDSS